MTWYQIINDIIGYFREKRKKNYKYVKIAFLRDNYPRDKLTLDNKEFSKSRGRALTKQEWIHLKQNYGDRLRFERFKE